MPFVATRMHLQGIAAAAAKSLQLGLTLCDPIDSIRLSEISQGKTNAVCYHLYVESKKYNKLMNITKQRGFPDGPEVKNLPCKAGDTGLIPGPERVHMLQGS